MSGETEVYILMATYNGGAYLARQLDSILHQSYANWKLIIRDDQSTDNTLRIIREYEAADPRISLINVGTMHGSACKNFAELTSWAMIHTSGPVMYADQDDIWLPEKIAVSVQELQQMGQEFGTTMPLLCYSTFQFIDERDQYLPQRLTISPQLELPVLLNENHAWGCTMIMNRAALEKVVPIPVEAVNHDYWTALTVAGLGKTKCINEDLILYRQHTQNVSGNVGNMSFASRFNRYVIDLDYMLKPLRSNLTTVELFYSRFEDQLSAQRKSMVNAFISSYHNSFLSLAATLFKYQIFKIGKGKNLIYFYTLFRLRKKVVAQKSTPA